MTRRQKLLADALEHVRTVERGTSTASAYGGLCHKLPLLIQRNGLCQTVAFLASKAGNAEGQKKAYGLVRDHLAAVLGQRPDALLTYVSQAPLEAYMRDTRTALLAWTFYKRLAVSLLGVESAQDETEAEV